MIRIIFKDFCKPISIIAFYMNGNTSVSHDCCGDEWEWWDGKARLLVMEVMVAARKSKRLYYK